MSNTTRISRKKHSAANIRSRIDQSSEKSDTVNHDTLPGALSKWYKTNQPNIQAKLEVSSPDDSYEQEANSVADQVVGMSDKPENAKVNRKEASSLQLQDEKEEPIQAQLIQRQTQEEEKPIQASRISTLTGTQSNVDTIGLKDRLSSTSGQGSPLPDNTRTSMENSFGVDFGQVRVHTDTNAVQMNKELGAQAFTHGNDIYFNSGKYNPESSSGKHLLAHELTHTVQQYPSSKSIQRQSRQNQSNSCSTYESGEEATSHTENGILPQDVVLLENGRLLISDFGVDWRHLKTSTVNESLLRDWLIRFETDQSYFLTVNGYTDCVGEVDHNESLRQQRALNVVHLLGPSARRRSTSHGAPSINYVNDNSTRENRARNRSALIEFRQEYSFRDENVRAPICSSLMRANSINDYIYLVVCLESALPSYSPRQILSLLRQLYYSDASFTSCRGRGCRFFSDVITCGISMPDPRPVIGMNLYNALVDSKVVDGIDFGHIFTGLEAMVCPRSSVELNVPGPNWTVPISNESFATWGGDLGSAVAEKINDELDRGLSTQAWSRYFLTPGSLASREDLLGDIDSYGIRTGLTGVNSRASSMTPIASIGKPISEILFDYYSGNSGSSSSHNNRFLNFVNALGATVTNGRITSNRMALIENVRRSTMGFADNFYQLKYHQICPPVGYGSWIMLYTDQITSLFVEWLEQELLSEHNRNP